MKVFGSSSKDPGSTSATAISSFCDQKTLSSALTRLTKPFSSSPAATASQDHIALLPVIVENAEATPAAAVLAIKTLRKRLDFKHGASTVAQYNAVIVLRVLADANSPNILARLNDDSKLVTAIVSLLNSNKDLSVKHLLRDTLRHFAVDMPDAVPALAALHKDNHPTAAAAAAPPVTEIISEANSSAGLLRQMLLSTPPVQLAASPLVLEFYDRCVALAAQLGTVLSANSLSLNEVTTAAVISASEEISTTLDLHKAALDRAATLVSPPREYYEDLQDHHYANDNYKQDHSDVTYAAHDVPPINHDDNDDDDLWVSPTSSTTSVTMHKII
ncbi:hypothetical protein V1514DRAFT_341869 [Lipomyces japonicus]|uniref:uncharacterized protein n=1 Tax=Lipomyces japonicus TaxID=56871 RepID=UPI0034CD049C